MPKSSKGFLRVASFSCEDFSGFKDSFGAPRSLFESLGFSGSPWESLGSLLDSLGVLGNL